MDGLESFSYHLPTQIHFGVGLFSSLADLIRPLPAERCLVLTSPGFPRRHPDEWKTWVSRKEATLFSEVGPNPSVAAIESYRNRLGAGRWDTIIGIGGGSVMDTARILTVALNQKASVREMIAAPARFVPRSHRLVLVPTTSGTASEVTPWATVWDLEQKKKLSLAHSSLFADIAVVDPTLTVGMSLRQTAITGMDTLSHCLESLWSKGSRPVTELFAKEALELVLIYLPQAVAHPEDLVAREGMAKACLLAGMAFSQTRTAAAHGISYPLTLFHEVPHGIACSVTLPALLIENARGESQRLLQIAQLFGADSVMEASQILRRFMKSIGMPTTLSELGIRKEDIGLIVENSASPGRMDNNIRELSRADVQRLLESIL